MSPFLRFDFVDAAGAASPLVFAHPARVIEARRVDEVEPAFRAAEQALRDGAHVAGFVGYDAAPAFDPAFAAHASSDTPLVWFGVFDAPRPAAPLAPATDDGTSAREDVWTPDLTADAHGRGVDSVRDAIARGDVYQANYTFHLRARLPAARRRVLQDRYERLAADHRPPYAAFVDTGGWQILSLSPELFFRLDGRRLRTRPMKGTAARGRWLEEDQACAEALRASGKNRAENVMIADMARNDVGRIAEIGSVRVTALCEIETYPTVLQMVSEVEGRLRPEVTLAGVFGALFPAASITGAPKVSATRLIARLENRPRGVYCGAIGFAAPNGDAVFNVAIRTMVVQARTGEATYGAGGGITWDSTAGDEYAEAMRKSEARSPLPAFDLIETLRAERGVCIRATEHLARLRASAIHCGFRYDGPRIEAALDAHAAGHPRETRRVRLLLARDGRLRVASRPLEPPPESPPPVALADAPVDRRDWRLYHKTTLREVYERHAAGHPHAFDVVLWNDAGELTELTRANLVVEIDAVCWTPPRHSGLLGGVLRAELLATDAVRERVLSRDDLRRATRVWSISSLRGWQEVRVLWA